jgi:DNA mismatch repair ATPase MutS
MDIVNPVTEVHAPDQTLYKGWYAKTVKLIDQLKRRSTILAWLRLVLFILFVASVFIGVNNTSILWASVILLIAFLFLINYHSRVTDRLKYNEIYSTTVEDELLAFDNKFRFDSGIEYSDSAHSYINDLDIFGNDSLFQSLNRTSTIHGRDTLASLFIDPKFNKDQIIANQHAISELSTKSEWLLHFRTYGILGNTSETSEKELLSWIVDKPLFISRIYTLLIWIIPVLSLGALYLVATGIISFSQFMLYLLIPLGIPAIFSAGISKRHMQVSRKAVMLENYSKRLNLIEKEVFSSDLLKKLQDSIKGSRSSASSAIKHLGKIITSIDARLNWLMWIILNYLLLWDIRQIQRLEIWQKEHREDLQHWFATLSKVEALSSLAGFSILNPAFVYAEPIDNNLMVEAKGAGHPLIPAYRRVTNDIKIEGKGSYSIITGANMAGKSTYLRTVGINLVLARIGAPVCAESFKFYPANIFTSLHTVDSLSSNKSYFFAELERLKFIIDTLNSGEEIYIFLDEILKGTNSFDKQQGSKALLKQLVSMGGAGMIATHDLDLGQLELTFPNNISNHCFEAYINDNELIFDYKLKPGIARNMNATFLMKQMGITI